MVTGSCRCSLNLSWCIECCPILFYTRHAGVGASDAHMQVAAQVAQLPCLNPLLWRRIAQLGRMA